MLLFIFLPSLLPPFSVFSLPSSFPHLPPSLPSSFPSLLPPFSLSSLPDSPSSLPPSPPLLPHSATATGSTAVCSGYPMSGITVISTPSHPHILTTLMYSPPSHTHTALTHSPPSHTHHPHTLTTGSAVV